MNPSTLSRPPVDTPDKVALPVQAPPVDGGDLDTRILRTEQRLIEREERLQRDARALLRRVTSAAEPKRLIVPVVGSAFAGLSLWWAFRRSRSASASPQSSSSGPVKARDFAWVGAVVPVIWPVLPLTFRNRMSPATATTAVTLGMPLIARLFGAPTAKPGGGTTSDLPTVPYLDLARYAGTWHEVARLPVPFEALCDGQPSAHYRLRGAQVEVENSCATPDGKLRVVRGIGRVVPNSGNAKLEVSFLPAWLRWLPFAWADYWVLYVDDRSSDYRVALVGNPSRKVLWVLSRTRSLPAAEMQRVISIARDRGFDVERLRLVRS